MVGRDKTDEFVELGMLDCKNEQGIVVCSVFVSGMPDDQGSLEAIKTALEESLERGDAEGWSVERRY